MRLRDFKGESIIFIDANIFAYHLTRQDDIQVECSNFLEKIEFDQIRAVTTNFVIDEVCYSLIITKGAQLLQTTRIKTIQANLKKNKGLSEIC